MLKRRREKQQQMEIVIMEQMVPEDHFLRKVDRAVDFREEQCWRESSSAPTLPRIAGYFRQIARRK